MKLSALSTEEALDALCELTPYINNIVIDENLLAELRRKIDPDAKLTRAEIYAFGSEKLSALAPIVLKGHRADVYGILSVLNGKTPEEIGKQNILTTGAQIRDAVKDKELIAFFKSCVEPEESA